MPKPREDFNTLVNAMKEFLDPEGPHQKKIMQELSVDPVALKFTMAEPAPDGNFEILFVSRADSTKKQSYAGECDTVEILSFADGMRLAQHKECSGGLYIFQMGQKLIALNPALRDQNGASHYVM